MVYLCANQVSLVLFAHLVSESYKIVKGRGQPERGDIVVRSFLHLAVQYLFAPGNCFKRVLGIVLAK